MSSLETVAIVPVKALAEAKSRLAAVLTPLARRRLVLAMLDDVLAALAATSLVTRTLVVTPDPSVADAARARGAEIIRETGPSNLNAALRYALHHGPCVTGTRCLILPADIPLVTPDEIARLLQPEATGTGAASPRTVIAPSHDGGGTNALVLTDHDLMGPSFGADSFRRHLELAEGLHLDPRVVRLPGLGFDIDTPADLRRLSQIERYHWLNEARANELRPVPPRAHQTA